MDRDSAEFSHDPDGLRSNVEPADRVGAACVEHSIEDGNADSRFDLLAREASCSQARTDQCESVCCRKAQDMERRELRQKAPNRAIVGRKRLPC